MAQRWRRILTASTAFFLLVPALGFAQMSQDVEPPPLKAEMTGILTAGSSELYLAADPSVVWKPGVLAAGVGVELLVGMSQFDIYLLPYLRAEIAWFHLDFGYALALARPPVGEGLRGPSLGIAAAPKPFEMGYGSAGFDLGFDFNLATFTIAYGVYAAAPAVQRIIASAIASGRVGFGFTYSFALL